MATPDNFEVLQFEDSGNFDRFLGIALRARRPRLAITTDVDCDGEVPSLPKRLNYWLGLWWNTHPGQYVGMHKNLPPSTATFLEATLDIHRHALALWCDEETLADRGSLLAAYDARIRPTDGKITVLFVLKTSRRANPIVQLAEAFPPGPIDSNSLGRACETLLRQGIEWHEMQEAIQSVLAAADAPTPTIDLVTRIICCLAEKTGRVHAAAEFHFQAADKLDERHDVESLTAAVWHYEQARQIGMAESVDMAIVKVNEGAARTKLADLGVEALQNLNAAVELFAEVLEDFGEVPPIEARVKVNESAARFLLASLEIKVEENLRAAVQLASESRPAFKPLTREYGLSLVNEANARAVLGVLGFEPQVNLESAVELCEQAKPCFEPTDPFCGMLRVNQASALDHLGGLGIEPIGNLQRALGLCTEAEKWMAGIPSHLGRLRMNEGVLRAKLAEAGVDQVANAQAAIRASQQARRHLPKSSLDLGNTILAEANARGTLAGLGKDEEDNLDAAVELFKQARQRVARDTLLDARIQANEAIIRRRLAEIGREPVKNLKAAVFLCEEARSRLFPHSPEWCHTLLNEAGIRGRLAEFGIDKEDNLRAAVRLYKDARDRLGLHSKAVGICLRDEATARRRLAQAGIDPLPNLHSALELAQQARRTFPSQTDDSAIAHMAEASIRALLAAEGQEPDAHLQEAIRLYEEGRRYLPEDHSTHVMCLVNQAKAHLLLAQRGTDSGLHLPAAVQLFETAESSLPSGTALWGAVERSYAEALRLGGRGAEAHTRLENGLRVVEATRSQIHTERERIAFLEEVSMHYALAVDLCLELAAAERSTEERDRWTWQAWHWCHRSKNRALVELMANGRPRLRPEDRSLWDEYERLGKTLCQLQNDLEMMTKRETGSGATAQMRRDAGLRLQRGQEEYDAARRRVGEQVEGASMLGVVEIPTPSEAVAALRELAGCPSGEGTTPSSGGQRPLLVEFFALDTTDVLVFLLPLWEDARLTVERIVLGPKVVENLALAVLSRVEKLSAVEQLSPEDAVAAEQRFARLGEETAPLVEPWGKHLETWNPTEVVLSPHYFLNLLPLHTAVWKGKSLIDRVPVVYLPSPVLAQEILRRAKPKPSQAVLVGNPTGDLPHAQEEVRHIADRLERNNLSCISLRGSEATVDNVLVHAREAGILHFACHAILESEFLRSGLELAGRRLTALDMMARLELPRTALCYLNSCNSALAAPGRTDELMALVRVFLYAGSPSVIASLWPAKDAASGPFAAHFYTAWVGKAMSRARAFQESMLWVKARFPDPAYWAPFVMVGAWTDRCQAQ